METEWTYVPQPNSAAPLRLFCFHHAGASAQLFRKLGIALAGQAEVRAVQLPGRANRFKEEPITMMGTAVREIFESVANQFTGRFAFLGCSLGAILAFELARELRRRGGEAPLALIMASRGAPQLPFQRWKPGQLKEDDFLDLLNRNYGAIPDGLLDDPELRELFLPILRADMDLLWSYEYTVEGPLSVPIYAFAGLEDPGISLSQLDSWREQTTVEFQTRQLPGDHFFFVNQTEAFVEALRSVLGRI